MPLHKEYTLGKIGHAVKDVRAYITDFRKKCELFVRWLCERGQEIAREEAPVDTGELRSSITAMAMGLAGQIIASSPHAAYVEFGTGIVGAGSPHPTLPWTYDVNGHGADGWWYLKDGSWRWTAGQPARAYMYTTAKRLAAEAPQIARDVFGV